MIELLDAPAEATGWSAAVASGTWQQQGKPHEQVEYVAEGVHPSNLTCECILPSGYALLMPCQWTLRSRNQPSRLHSKD